MAAQVASMQKKYSRCRTMPKSSTKNSTLKGVESSALYQETAASFSNHYRHFTFDIMLSQKSSLNIVLSMSKTLSNLWRLWLPRAKW